jgi:hypothetical protein
MGLMLVDSPVERVKKDRTGLKLKSQLEDFYIQIIPVLRRFPKVEKYTLAENIEKQVLSSIRLLLIAEYEPKKRMDSLVKLRINFHMTHFLLRVSHTQCFIKAGAYEQLSRQIFEMGKMTTGWIKRENKKNL